MCKLLAAIALIALSSRTGNDVIYAMAIALMGIGLDDALKKK